jgi:predicted proteasome-type protease
VPTFVSTVASPNRLATEEKTDLMEQPQSYEWVPNYDNSLIVLLVIAGTCAVTFIVLLIVDSRRRARSSGRTSHRSRPNIFKRMAMARQTLREEMARRRSRNERRRPRKR